MDFTGDDSTRKGQEFADQNLNRISIAAVAYNLWDFGRHTGIKQIRTVYWSSRQWQRYSNGTMPIQCRDHLLCV